MKKSMKTKLAIGTFALALGMASIFPAPSHALRAEALDDSWGKPAKVERMESGGEIRYYKLDANISEGYRIFEVRKDGKVIDKGFSEEAERYYLTPRG